MASHDLITTIADLLHADAARVEQRMDDLDINQMLDLVDAVAMNDPARVHALMGGGMDEAEQEETPPRRARATRARKDPPVEESGYQARIGDDVLVDGKEATVKIARGPNDTVGVMIDGELTMVNKGQVRPLTEHVLGMTMLPDLKRMQELAGIAGIATDAPEPPTAPGSAVEVLDVTPEPETACATETPKTAIDAAIDQLERLLPMLRVGDYKDVAQRIQKALNVINESLGEVLGARRLAESESRFNDLRVSLRISQMLRRIETILRHLRAAFDALDDDGTYDRSFDSLANLIKSIETLVRPPRAATEARRPARSFKDYLGEMETDAAQTIGNNRADAIKSLKARLGDTATIQDASKAFDKMRTTGKIKQHGNKMTMQAMGDEELQGMVGGNSGTGK